MYIKLEDGTIAEANLPDPRRVLTPEQAQEEIRMKQEEIERYEYEITNFTERKTALENEILELNNLLQ